MSTPPEQHRSLAAWLKRMVILNQDTVVSLLTAEDTPSRDLVWVYFHPRTAPHNRLGVVQHSACPPALLSHVSRIPGREGVPFRHCAAQHHLTPIKNLISLCGDPASAVAEAAMRNPSTPTTALFNRRLLRGSLRPALFDELASRPDGAEAVETYLIEQGFLIERGLIPFDLMLAFLPDE